MRFKMPRASFILPGAIKIASKKSSAVAYLQPSRSGTGALCALGFYGNADKPSFHYSFKDDVRRAKYVAEWLKDMDAKAAYKAEQVAARKAKMAEPHKLAVGDVLRSVWGYEQTNVYYYEVTALIGSRMVEIREIGCESVETMYMQGESVPMPGKFVGEPMRKKVSENGDSVRIESYAGAYKIEPVLVAGIKVYKPDHWTAYA